MALVNNASGVYATLGYNFNDPNGTIQNFSANTQSVMGQLPPLIKAWQAQDIANNNVGGYFQNPVATDVNNIITISNQIYILANSISGNANTTYAGTANLDSLIPSAQTLNITASSFLIHTNKISGVTSIVGATDTNVNPYYQTAVNYGKQTIYLTNQTDGIVNNSPIMGSMTSILVGPQISANSNTLSADYIILTNGISGNTISDSQVTQIVTDMTNINAFLSGRQSSDVTFFGNIINFVSNYNATQQFANMGETETYLCNNIIGTPKLVSRINS
jgi:hypothetical protein